MPVAALPRCTWPGCRTRVAGGGRCPEHRPSRASARARGYDSVFDALARQVIAEEPICQRCGERPSEVAGHIVPRPHGSNERANLRGLCRRCNAQEAAEQRKGTG